MKLAQDAHTRAKQVYECLWQTARPLDEVSLPSPSGSEPWPEVVRLSESNARINVRSLIAKLAIEELGDYNCERSVGRTYRILNYTEILKRRREAGLVWVYATHIGGCVRRSANRTPAVAGHELHLPALYKTRS